MGTITTEATTKAIGEILRDVRLIRTHKKLLPVAKAVRQNYRVKIDSSYLSRMEKGKVEIPMRTLFALCNYYKIKAWVVLWLALAGSEDGDGAENDL